MRILSSRPTSFSEALEAILQGSYVEDLPSLLEPEFYSEDSLRLLSILHYALIENENNRHVLDPMHIYSEHHPDKVRSAIRDYLKERS